MLTWLGDYWPVVLVVETVVLVWSLTRPAPKWDWLLRGGRPVELKYAVGCPSKFWFSKVGRRPKGMIARVDVDGPEANVRLVDDWNYRRMRRQKRYAYVGGHYRVSPIDLSVPWDGRWYVVADLGGEPGHLRARTRFVTGSLPSSIAAPSTAPPRLGRIRKNKSGPSRLEERDVFISYATEDRAAVARPLADALLGMKVSVWLDEYEMHIGDSIREKIDDGIRGSRFGVLVLSPNYFEKHWTRAEADAFMAIQMEGVQVILPIWHEMTKGDVLGKAPTLAGKVALSTGQYTIPEIAAEIATVVLEQDLEVSDARTE